MAKNNNLNDFLKDVADGIRAKKGTTALINAQNFRSEIASIETGITPTGSIDITSNGTVDVTNYASANVNVANQNPYTAATAEEMAQYLVSKYYGAVVKYTGTTGTYTQNRLYKVIQVTSNEYTFEELITPVGSTTKTANGTYDVKEYAEVIVNVPIGITPTGNINITDTNTTDVTNYATAKVVDSNLVASNIKKDINILGVTGTLESGGVQLPEKAFVISGNCQSRFANNGWNWFIEEFGDQITTRDTTNRSNMFDGSDQLINIPFDINQGTLNINPAPFLFQYIFQACNSLTNVPRINFPADINNYDFNNANNVIFNQILGNCNNLRSADNLFNAEELSSYIQRIRYQGEYNHETGGLFNNCNSLRTVPSWFYSLKLNQNCYCQVPWNTTYYQVFNGCYALDEATNLIVWGKSTDNWGPDIINNFNGGYIENFFGEAFNNCHRLKNVTFETQTDGTPYTANWANQYIDLNYGGLGWNYNIGYSYNSGITADKEVSNNETYNALKNDPDWWTSDVTYSRYNHDSAVATINSLPNTSAFLATIGGATNTINFKGTSGSATDGGAINTLTEEEIAVATAKGWTVTIA